MINPNARDREALEDTEKHILARSIPALSSLRSLVPLVVSSALPPGKEIRGAYVLDVGTGRGDAVAPFATAGANVFAIEKREPVYRAARERFSGYANVTVVNDYAEAHARRAANDRDLGPSIRYDVVLAVLAVHHTPVEKRPSFFGDLFRITNPNGVIVLVEKIVEPSPFADRVTTTAYEKFRTSTGFITESKANPSIYPATPEANREFLRSAGYADVFSFYRALGFEGLVARNPRSW